MYFSSRHAKTHVIIFDTAGLNPALHHLSPNFRHSTQPHTFILPLFPMMFGFGVSDIVLVSGAVCNLYTAISNAPDEQQTLMIEVEILRQLIGQIAADTTLVSPLAIAGPIAQRAPPVTAAVQQISRCFQLLHSLDTIATKYIGNCSSLQSPVVGKKARPRVFRWGLYKRKEFVGLLADLRNMINLLHKLQQRGNPAPAQIGSPDTVSYVELTDALDRSWVCSFEHCNTYEVSCA